MQSIYGTKKESYIATHAETTRFSTPSQEKEEYTSKGTEQTTHKNGCKKLQRVDKRFLFGSSSGNRDDGVELKTMTYDEEESSRSLHVRRKYALETPICGLSTRTIAPKCGECGYLLSPSVEHLYHGKAGPNSAREHGSPHNTKRDPVTRWSFLLYKVQNTEQELFETDPFANSFNNKPSSREPNIP